MWHGNVLLTDDIWKESDDTAQHIAHSAADLPVWNAINVCMGGELTRRTRRSPENYPLPSRAECVSRIPDSVKDSDLLRRSIGWHLAALLRFVRRQLVWRAKSGMRVPNKTVEADPKGARRAWASGPDDDPARAPLREVEECVSLPQSCKVSKLQRIINGNDGGDYAEFRRYEFAGRFRGSGVRERENLDPGTAYDIIPDGISVGSAYISVTAGSSASMARVSVRALPLRAN